MCTYAYNLGDALPLTMCMLSDFITSRAPTYAGVAINIKTHTWTGLAGIVVVFARFVVISKRARVDASFLRSLLIASSVLVISNLLSLQRLRCE